MIGGELDPPGYGPLGPEGFLCPSLRCPCEYRNLMPIVGEITRHGTLYLDIFNEKKPDSYFIMHIYHLLD